MTDLSRFGTRIWTIQEMQKVAREQKSGHTVYLDLLHYPEIFRDFDEHVFKLRPDLIFNVQSVNTDGAGECVPYSRETLEAISNMKYLKKLQMQFKFVQNLDELHSPTVTDFGLNFYKKTTKPMSLAFVRNFPNLAILRASDNEYTDYKVLAELKELKTLRISNVTLNELENIVGLGIEGLMLEACRLNCDLTCLTRAKIHNFGFYSNNNITDLDFIGKMTTLKSLGVSQAKVTALPNFSSLSLLEELSLSSMKALESIEVISSAQSLKRLSLMEIGTKVKADDFRVLLELPNLESVYIDYLDFGKNRIKSVRNIFRESEKEHLLKSGRM